MGQIAITKNSTIIIKGVAILFMIAHHILIKEFYVEPDSFLNSFFALRLQIGMKTCVGIFTFRLGYGFFFNRKYDAKYVISHMRRVLLRYWLVLLFTIFIASGEISPNILAHNLLGIMHQYNLGNWYIYILYICSVGFTDYKTSISQELFSKIIHIGCDLWRIDIF